MQKRERHSTILPALEKSARSLLVTSVSVISDDGCDAANLAIDAPAVETTILNGRHSHLFALFFSGLGGRVGGGWRKPVYITVYGSVL